jgi:hypothetical protein
MRDKREELNSSLVAILSIFNLFYNEKRYFKRSISYKGD